MAEVSNEVWKELRKPFPKEVIGKLPKGGISLDYVGHAAVTDRLLAVDPTWSWEPLAVNEIGLPATDNAGNLWIKLTVLGVTRIGVGDGKNAKECISDAIRNAAMRFGVALDLWSKEELESTLADPSMKNEGAAEAPAKPAVGTATPPSSPERITGKQMVKMQAMFNEFGIKERDERLAYISDVLEREISSSRVLSKTGATKVIDQLAHDITETEEALALEATIAEEERS